jgi:membrane-associated phospholipid phosphatase
VIISLVVLVLAVNPVVAPALDAGAPSRAVSIDGGDVPIVAPDLTSSVAKVLAPELVADGGVESDGGATPILAPETLSVYDVNLPAETAITAGLFSLYVMVDVLIKPSLGAGPNCLDFATTGQCNPADLSPFDRYAVGRESVPWTVFSDVALAVSLVAPLAYLALESLTLPTQQPFGDFFNDAMVMAESLALTATMQTVLKFAFRRPRPSNYLPGQGAANIDLQLSLPSGHAAMVAAATTALTTTIFLRHPDSQVRYVALTAGLALSVLTGFARVQAGFHFPTDAITALMLGGAVGFAVPILHRKASRLRPAVVLMPSSGLTLFTVSGDF